MIQVFVDRFMAAKDRMQAELRERPPADYDDLVKRVVSVIATHGHADPDPERIHVIDDGSYQGTRLYVVGANNYQPSTYWSIFVDYGSCSGCDTFEAIRPRYITSTDPLTDEEVTEYWTLMLHMVQSMRLIDPGRAA